MTTATNRAAALDRAYVQGRVIETSLERLSATVSEVDPRLRRDLMGYVRAFDEYVRRLRDAKMVADAADDSHEMRGGLSGITQGREP